MGHCFRRDKEKKKGGATCRQVAAGYNTLSPNDQIVGEHEASRPVWRIFLKRAASNFLRVIGWL